MKVTTDACLFGAWVARELKAQSHAIRNMIDIGTGTGLLTLMVAQKISHLIIDAVEIDRSAYLQAKGNIHVAGFKNTIFVHQADIRNDQIFGRYDVVISNPPFYENELKSGNSQKNMAHHDESLSLEELLPVIKIMLTATSKFYLLLPFKRKNEIEELLKKNNLFLTKIVSVRQSVNHDHFRLMIEGSLFDDYKPEESEISICDDKQQYTDQFTHLLKDYYLNL